jgi:hypothetical protein
MRDAFLSSLLNILTAYHHKLAVHESGPANTPQATEALTHLAKAISLIDQALSAKP